MRRILTLSLASFLLLGAGQQLLAQGQSSELLKLPGMKAGGTITRDSYGIPSIWALTVYDMAYLQGYVHAEDRLFQMDCTRRQISGTLAELFGSSVLAKDVEARTFGLRRAAVGSLTALSPAAREALDAYAAGVNQWVATHSLPPEYGALDLTKFGTWTPLDTVAIGKAFAFQLSFDDDTDTTIPFLTYVAAGKAAGFDGTALFVEDLWRTSPFEPFTTIPQSSSSARHVAESAEQAGANAARLDAMRTAADKMLANGVLELALAWQKKARAVPVVPGLLEGRRSGTSNEWGVSARLSTTGRPLVANDPHLALGTPAIWYPISLRGGKFNVAGNSFAGTPFVIHGQNEKVAWGSTVNFMDVTDWYAEKIVPAPGTATGLATVYKGVSEPLVAIPEVYKKNNPGSGTKDNITVVPSSSSIPAVSLVVPRRDNGPIVQLDAAAGSAISVQYTGFSPTREIDAIMNYDLAQNVEEFKNALRYFDVGSQNWAVADTSGSIAYFTSAEMPLREDLQSNTVVGAPPWFIRDGTGGNEWLPLASASPDQAVPHQILPYAEMPQVVNPAQGWFANGNNDPVGVTLGNNPLARQRAGGGIYYLNPYYDGYRGGRISQLIKKKLAANGKLSKADLKEIQADSGMIDAQYFVPFITGALASAQVVGADPALAAYAKDAAVVAAVGRLADWDFTTPTGIKEGYDAGKAGGTEPTAAQVKASVAATVYALWRSNFITNTVDAPLAPGNLPLPDRFLTMVALKNLFEKFPTRGGVGASGVNFFNVPGVARAEDRRDVLILKSISQGLALLASDAFAPAFAKSTNLDDYRWGKLHRIVFSHPLGGPFNVPPAGGAFPDPLGATLPGIPRQGGFEVVDRSDHNDIRAKTVNGFMFTNGPSRRYVGEALPAGIQGDNTLPGGVSGVVGNPNYCSLLPLWLQNQYYPLLVQGGPAPLPLANGNIAVEVFWKSQYSGQSGRATATPQKDSYGYFYFTDPVNAEVFVKVLDYGASSPYVVFYAGLTNYEYVVTFTNLTTGKTLSFTNPAGSLSGGASAEGLPHAVAHAAYWSRDGEWSEELKGATTVLLDKAAQVRTAGPRSEMVPAAANELLLSGGHVAVGATWKNPYSGQTGTATPVPEKDPFGFFYFSDVNNPEVVVKVLDFGASSPYLLFYASLTNFEYTVTYRNVLTGQSQSFKKDAGSFNGGADTTSLKH